MRVALQMRAGLTLRQQGSSLTEYRTTSLVICSVLKNVSPACEIGYTVHGSRKSWHQTWIRSGAIQNAGLSVHRSLRLSWTHRAGGSQQRNRSAGERTGANAPQSHRQIRSPITGQEYGEA